MGPEGHRDREAKMVEIGLSIGPEAFSAGSYVYVWFAMAPKAEAIYVGETSKGTADRVGLHLRLYGDTKRSGAEVADLLRRRKLNCEDLIILSFPIPKDVLDAVIAENKSIAAPNRPQMARRAIERQLYEELHKKYPKIHPVKNCKWKATSAANLITTIVSSCAQRIGAQPSVARDPLQRASPAYAGR